MFFYDHRPKLTTHFDRVIHWSRNPELGILTRLSHVSLRDGPVYLNSGVQAVSLSRLIPYLQIPSLRKLYVRNLCDRSRLNLPKDLVSSLTHIDFEEPQEILPNLPRLLQRCPILISFTLEQGRPYDRHCSSGHNFLDVSQLYDPLQRSRPSIRHLHIAFADNGRHTWQDTATPAPSFFGALFDFPSLHTVHMRWSNLIPFHGKSANDPTVPLWTLLPSSLQNLYIENCLMQCSLVLANQLECLITYLRDSRLPLQRLFLQFAYEECKSGQACQTCTKRWPKSRDMELEPAWEGRLRGIKERLCALGVSFQVVERGACVTFPLDHAIRHKWYYSQSGKLYYD